VKDASANGRRQITAYVLAYTEGQSVCKHGKITGFDCGEVVGFTDAWWVVNSSNDFVIVNGSSDMAELGDSGGATYRDTTALGTIIGEYENNNRAIFMPVKFAWCCDNSFAVRLLLA
jgi:hypothetical protein